MAATIPIPPRKYELAPKGDHAARCVVIADMGTQPSVQGDPYRKMVFLFELIGKRWKDGTQAPILVKRFFAVGFGPKAGLRLMLEPWLGRELTREECKGAFDFSELVGLSANLFIVHKKDGERMNVNIQSVTPEREGQIIGDMESLSALFMLNEPDMKEFAKLPAWIQKIVQGSPEWAVAAGGGPAPQPTAAREPGADEEGGDSIPF